MWNRTGLNCSSVPISDIAMANDNLPFNALKLDRQLCFAIYSTSLAMTKLYKPLLESLGLTYPQYLVMLILWEKDCLALKDIGEQLNIDSGALTPVMKRLEALGYLVRRRLPINERALEIALTPQGKALREKALDVNRFIGLACDSSDDELNNLRSSLLNLRAKLVKHVD